MKDNKNNTNLSLEEYTAFHGMLCRPQTALRAIETFKGGAIVFATQKDYDAFVSGETDLSHFDCNIMPVKLNVWTYYLLVLLSLTGFCSILGCTKVIKAVEYDTNDSDGDENKSGDTPLRFQKGDKTCIESLKTASTLPLRLPPEAMDYVIDQSIREEIKTNPGATGDRTPELTLVRRFEYDFGGFLSVMMLHFLCTNGRTHLVEIYRVNMESTIGTMAKELIKIMYALNSLLLKLKLRPEPVDETKKTN